MENLSAFVLAGGKSTRMGADKAFLELNGQPLIAHALALARSLTADVRIVGDPMKFSALTEAIPDVYAGRGPLGGIHAALGASHSDLNLVLAVDLPFLQPAFLKYLLAQAQVSEAIVTVPFAAGHFHPLCAIYRREFYEHADRALSAGKNKLDALFSEVSTRVISQRKLTKAGFTSSMFRNLNTLADLEQARRELV